MDTLGRAARSELMARVKSRGTAPERALLRAMREAGAVPSRSAKGLPGTPDAAFRRAKVAVFVDGCFWHGCPLHGRVPAGGASEVWGAKLAANKRRDAAATAELETKGWLVIRVWEHELAKAGDASAAGSRVAAAVAARLGLG